MIENQKSEIETDLRNILLHVHVDTECVTLGLIIDEPCVSVTLRWHIRVWTSVLSDKHSNISDMSNFWFRNQKSRITLIFDLWLTLTNWKSYFLQNMIWFQIKYQMILSGHGFRKVFNFVFQFFILYFNFLFCISIFCFVFQFFILFFDFLFWMALLGHRTILTLLDVVEF